MSESCPTRLANASSFRTVPARGGAFVTSALVGWEHNGGGVDPPLSTSDGVAVRSVWADHLHHLDVAEWGCYSVGDATTRDMRVVVFSVGDPFLACDDDGNRIPTDPDPADVTVTQLSAGSLPGSPEWDC